MQKTHYAVCNICESTCGLEIVTDGKNIISIKGDRQNPFSRGHICPKAQAHKDIYNDPDRLRHPVRRNGDHWEKISWNEAIREVAGRLVSIQKKHGNDALAFYYGDPALHNNATFLMLKPFKKSLKSKNLYSAISVDSLPKMLVSYLMYGNQVANSIPDIDRTDYMLILGANPLVSNGSLMTASNIKKRLKNIQERGGRIVVIDPRKNETAAIADDHYFIRPGTDALFLLAMLHTIFREGLYNNGNVLSIVKGVDELRELVKPFTPERVSRRVSIPADDIRKLTREFATAESAVCYGRMGISTQEYGSTTTWLMEVVNIVTGNLDRPGGVMFTTPAANLAGIAKLLKETGSFNQHRSRVGGLPEFNGELPVAALAEEMETSGPGQVKALVTLAGNICLSRPNSGRLLRALGNLEYIVSIDIYINETSRHANIILPPACSLEEDHFEAIFYALAVRNIVNYSTSVFPKPVDAKHDWEILLALIAALNSARGFLPSIPGRIMHPFMRVFNPKRQLDLLLRLGPHSLSLKKLKQSPHGIDLGPLEPRVKQVINTPDKKIKLIPENFLKEVERLNKSLDEKLPLEKGALQLIGRRSRKGMNSWLHNCPSLQRGKIECTLLMNPEDARQREFENGQIVKVATSNGSIEIEMETTLEMMPGVVSIPHGWGHDLPGVKLSLAKTRPGVNVNLITNDDLIDKGSGTSVLYGIPVVVTSVEQLKGNL
ncbi:molybdopterin-dependent oxidoreductase [Desulfosudis oleivorans]|uniref:Molybdopterin oxidoreductase n=1 Tax=Desulfosudis oleivorans (strain DSM 6200 / JCM 39069 / Hxd3) TaxID=96561 RepID=A8ZX27_DESOH|nr:molybdopterin-dependent oxidoreductase [Desulfosudis oleivorans]ABW66883.1 molybdopterin oxidoreductase [Desulfosudis oleivorans Hxd3]